ncbi:nucleotidyltransferase [Mycoplasmopsis ciconiae]|uniref:Nucleotidyltransferase n=1 Tax=Mycoplasmopsis ciconiae TaxID=561067 RepID=A0ABU7MM25_9BACT|nr:nucleotidyltransferase [Mycoplasmopsis ciconiae]
MKLKKVKIGIVAEYNPFHNGHIYQLQYAKKLFPNSQIIVAMSHKYTQRGEIAVASYRQRKKYAKKYGADKFVKLGVNISSQAAHIFAKEAVLKLNKKKIDYLLFGSESDNVENLLFLAQTLKNNKQQYNQLVKKHLKNKGTSFPKACNLALEELTNQQITLPNDILGIEYVKTIVDNDLKIKPISIKRTIDFHSETTHLNFASASKLRSMLKNNQDISEFSPMIINPKKIKYIENLYPKFQKIVKNKSAKELTKYKMISEGIENLFKKHIDQPSYEAFVQECTSKRYTSSRIKRTILFVLLKIKK